MVKTFHLHFLGNCMDFCEICVSPGTEACNLRRNNDIVFSNLTRICSRHYGTLDARTSSTVLRAIKREPCGQSTSKKPKSGVYYTTAAIAPHSYPGSRLPEGHGRAWGGLHRANQDPEHQLDGRLHRVVASPSIRTGYPDNDSDSFAIVGYGAARDSTDFRPGLASGIGWRTQAFRPGVPPPAFLAACLTSG